MDTMDRHMSSGTCGKSLATSVPAAQAWTLSGHYVQPSEELLTCAAYLFCGQVLEFVCFKERLQRSHNYVLARAEHAILSIGTAAATSPGAAAKAAQAAVVDIPLAVLDSLDWQGMRFNDDLTTRVPWLPPIAGPRHHQLLLWWEQHQQQRFDSSEGSSSSNVNALWWKEVSSAEADLQPAAQYRAALQAAAMQRWLLPHLLAAATHVAGLSASSSAAQQQPQLLQRYAASVSGNVAALQQELQQSFGGQKSQHCPGVVVSRQLQLLDAALLMLAEPVQVCSAAGRVTNLLLCHAVDRACAHCIWHASILSVASRVVTSLPAC